MRFSPTALKGVMLVDLTPAFDDRGFFARLHCPDEFAAAGFPFEPVQTSLSRNLAAHTLRAFSVPVILQGPGNTVLAVQLWSFWDHGRVGEATAMAVLLIVGLGIISVGGRVLVARTSKQSE